MKNHIKTALVCLAVLFAYNHIVFALSTLPFIYLWYALYRVFMKIPGEDTKGCILLASFLTVLFLFGVAFLCTEGAEILANDFGKIFGFTIKWHKPLTFHKF